MTSHDVRDMLDLPGEAAPRPAKKAKPPAPRNVLKGLAREVQNLGGDNPIAIVPEVMVFKKRRFGTRKPAAKWEWSPFTNSGREDKAFTLRHWKRKEEIVPIDGIEENGMGESESANKLEPQVEDSTFAKFNVKVIVPEYNDEIYNSTLKSDDWTKDETDYLLELARDYDLRWPIIWDRYEYTPKLDEAAMEGAMVLVEMPRERTMEEMKDRYYKVAARMMEVNKARENMDQREYTMWSLMNHYNAANEKKRKDFAQATFTRTREEVREEESLILELNRIMKRAEKLNEDREELYARLDAPNSAGNSGIYGTSQGLQQLLQQLLAADKSKKGRRSIMGGVNDGVSPAPGAPSQPPNFDRRESSVRESTSGPTGGPSNNKKGASTQPGVTERRVLSPEEEALFGVRKVEKSGTGSFFRHDKIMKNIVGKSTSQQARINNALMELGIRPRLIMPTQQVGEVFETVLTNVGLMLDERKKLDKILGEIAIAEGLIATKEAQAKAAKGEAEPSTTEEADTTPLDSEEVAKVEVSAQEGMADASAVVDGGTIKNEDVGPTTGLAPSSVAASRPGSGHKRSASVMSVDNDKEAKRLKK